MHVLLFADRAGPALDPFTRRTCVALLPVVGKPLVVHALESLARVAPTRVFVVVSPHADAVEAELGDGRRWGLSLEYVLTRGDESPDAIAERLRPRLAADFLIVRGDVLVSPCLPEFLERAAAVAGTSVAATIGARPAGIRLVRRGAPSPLGLPADPENAPDWHEETATVEIPAARFSGIESLAAYHRANLDAVAGRYGALIVPGRAVAPGVFVGRQTRLSLECVQASPVFVGSRCDVKSGAELQGEVVVSDDVVVDHRATIRAAVILPHTYVGEMVEVSNAIVWSNDLVHVDSGGIARVTDEFLLADLGSAALEEGTANLLHRLAGAMLLLLSLPLWPVLLVASLLADPSRPFRVVDLVGNRTEIGREGRRERKPFRALEAATRIPLLRHLPLLLPVVRGDLRLVGVSPMTPESTARHTEDWEKLRDRAPAGLLGPAQLSLSRDAPEEERLVLEAYYAQTRTGTSDLVWLARGASALFSSRAWDPEVRPGAS